MVRKEKHVKKKEVTAAAAGPSEPRIITTMHFSVKPFLFLYKLTTVSEF